MKILPITYLIKDVLVHTFSIGFEINVNCIEIMNVTACCNQMCISCTLCFQFNLGKEKEQILIL